MMFTFWDDVTFIIVALIIAAGISEIRGVMIVKAQ